MTVRQALLDGSKPLGACSETPFLDSFLLLGHATGLPKEKLLASYDQEITNESYALFESSVEKRISGVPIAYILGTKEFYGLTYSVDSRVLVPRADTETLVDAVLNLCETETRIASLHDCCTGSGCLAISIKKNLPHLTVSASDICGEALSVFRKNCIAILNSELPNTISSYLADVTGVFDIIIANPPYLTTADVDAKVREGWREPSVSLDGGNDGLDPYRQLIPQSIKKLQNGGYLLLEADPGQMPEIEKMYVQSGFQHIILYEDLARRKRVIQGKYGRVG